MAKYDDIGKGLQTNNVNNLRSYVNSINKKQGRSVGTPNSKRNQGSPNSKQNQISFGDDIGFDDFEPDSNGTQYKIIGTDKIYIGKVVSIGGHLYTTNGGGIEGERQQVIIETLPTLDT